MSKANSAGNSKSASKTASPDQAAPETAVISTKEKRRLAEKILKRMEAGDKLPPDEELVLLAWSKNTTPAMKARIDKVIEARLAAKQPEPPEKTYTETDLQPIGVKLDDVGYMLIALHEVASSHDIDGEVLEIMAIEFAKRGMRIIDACHEKLGQSKMGNFASEFEEAAEVA